MARLLSVPFPPSTIARQSAQGRYLRDSRKPRLRLRPPLRWLRPALNNQRAATTVRRAEARLPERDFQFDPLAQQFRSGGVARFEAFSNAYARHGVVEFDPPSLAPLEF